MVNFDKKIPIESVHFVGTPVSSLCCTSIKTKRGCFLEIFVCRNRKSFEFFGNLLKQKCWKSSKATYLTITYIFRFFFSFWRMFVLSSNEDRKSKKLWQSFTLLCSFPKNLIYLPFSTTLKLINQSRWWSAKCISRLRSLSNTIER